jgi:hypothetical protein
MFVNDRDKMSNPYREPSIDASYQETTQNVLNKLDSSPLKPFGQMNQNLVGSIYGRLSIKSAHFVPIH